MIQVKEKEDYKTTLKTEIEKLEKLGETLGINADEIIHIIKTREFREENQAGKS